MNASPFLLFFLLFFFFLFFLEFLAKAFVFCKHAVQEKHIKSNDKNANVKSGKKNDRRKVYFQWMMVPVLQMCCVAIACGRCLFICYTLIYLLMYSDFITFTTNQLSQFCYLSNQM